MAAKKNKKVNAAEKKKTDAILSQVKAVILIATAVFLFVCLQFTDQTGFLGTVINLIFKTLFGEAAIALPFFFLIASLGYFWPYKIENLKNRLIGLAIVFALLVISLHLRAFLQGPAATGWKNIFFLMMELGLLQQGGGLLGALLTTVLFFLFKDLGSYIVITALGLIALMLITNNSFWELYKGARGIFGFVGKFCQKFNRVLSYAGERKETAQESSYTIKDYAAFQPVEEEGGEEVGAGGKENNGLIVFPAGEEFKNEEIGKEADISKEKSASPPEETPATISRTIIENNEPYEGYKIPPLDLLTKVNRLRDYQQQKLIHERAKALENTFESFGVKVRIKEVLTGPAVTRYEIQPETGVKVSKILSLSDDLALNLAASDVRIEAPIPGKAAIGIEVPNKIISLVYLREVLEDSAFQNSASPLITGLGKDITGVPVFADLIKMPHLLVAGSTGSGKSVCINSILCSILFKAPPWKVKFLLIDPKIVELSVYNGIPHLISPVVTEAKKASQALRAMVKEMERRYELFAQSGVRDISKYNEAYDDSLPYIVVVIDELADLMMVAPSEVEDSIVRLSQMARAAGIHLVIATQRPSVDVITGLIKANIPSRIAFAVSSQIDSRTILDTGGAEKLLGRGDMLYHPIGLHKMLRVQGAFISENDIVKVVDFIKQQESPLYQHSFLTEETTEEIVEEDTDILLPEAIDLVLETGHASISLIQRRFRIGYNRAARIIDDMERLGIVGKFEGSKPRQVLVRADQVKGILEGKIKAKN
ncbi:MAG: DNA translocase FtsK [Firmicutes bacterium]|nr:DNA translocase FtsK [Bacillota bacterium]